MICFTYHQSLDMTLKACSYLNKYELFCWRPFKTNDRHTSLLRPSLKTRLTSEKHGVFTISNLPLWNYTKQNTDEVGTHPHPYFGSGLYTFGFCQLIHNTREAKLKNILYLPLKMFSLNKFAGCPKCRKNWFFTKKKRTH